MTNWHERWMIQQTGWHRAVYNDLLVKHWPTVHAAESSNVLVPLCGKSLDMEWLAQQGHTVTGLELVSRPIEDFFEERGLTPQQQEIGKLVRYSSAPYVMIQGDFFDVQPSLVQADAWYDRAAMVALPSAMREAYVDQLRALTKPGAVGLLITFSYPQHEMGGPPFSLPDEEVAALFSQHFELQCLEQITLDDERDRGLSSSYSSVYKLIRR